LAEAGETIDRVLAGGGDADLETLSHIKADGETTLSNEDEKLLSEFFSSQNA